MKRNGQTNRQTRTQIDLDFYNIRISRTGYTGSSSMNNITYLFHSISFCNPTSS